MFLSGNANAVHNAVHKRSTHQIAKKLPDDIKTVRMQSVRMWLTHIFGGGSAYQDFQIALEIPLRTFRMQSENLING